MDWSRVPVFLKVVESESITGAAKLLGLPKSSVSRTVTALEKDLEVQLLRRTTRQLKLTEAGRHFYERAKAARAALEEAQAELDHQSDDAEGVVKLTVASDMWPLSHLLARFAKQHPKVHVELVVTNRYVNLVEEGVDLAIRAGRMADSTLIARRIAHDDLGLYATPEYLKRRGVPKKVEELGAHDVVLFRARHGVGKLKLTGPSGERELEVKGPVSADDLSFARALIHSGLGIGMLPVFLDHCSGKPTLERVLPDWKVKGGGVHLVMPASRYVPTRVRLLHDFLVENFVEGGFCAMAAKMKA